MIIRGKILFITIIYFCKANSGNFEGDSCFLSNLNENGTCVSIQDCQFAKNLLKMTKIPQNCGFDEDTPIVCCRKEKGQISFLKCKEFYPPDKNYQIAFAGGQGAKVGQFPHMAVLGYGEKENNTHWLCGGSLISEQFILTAAHCTYSRDWGEVKFVRIGDLDLNTTMDNSQPQNFTVSKVYVHPNYTPSSSYHDLAILKLHRPAIFNTFVKPICLHTQQNINPYDYVTAMGWGAKEFGGQFSTYLNYGQLKVIPNNECQNYYKNIPRRRLQNGINDEIQICAGSEGKDTCQGDSGGPLQIENYYPTQHYQLIGITSFGKPCVLSKSPGVYTRISYYLDWIENIVWS